MSDTSARLIAASILTAAGGLTLGLGLVCDAIRAGEGGVAIVTGFILLLVGGMHSVWYFARPFIVRGSGEARAADTANAAQEGAR